MAGISTHVLDTALGRPAAGVPVTLEIDPFGRTAEVAAATTDGDGRVASLLDGPLHTGTYRIRYDTAAYLGDTAFFPEVTVTFRVTAADEHHHIPLLLSPFGYSTYRGS
jgi:5-hydroxyisourate hydrolase